MDARQSRLLSVVMRWCAGYFRHKPFVYKTEELTEFIAWLRKDAIVYSTAPVDSYTKRGQRHGVIVHHSATAASGVDRVVCAGSVTGIPAGCKVVALMPKAMRDSVAGFAFDMIRLDHAFYANNTFRDFVRHGLGRGDKLSRGDFEFLSTWVIVRCIIPDEVVKEVRKVQEPEAPPNSPAFAFAE